MVLEQEQHLWACAGRSQALISPLGKGSGDPMVFPSIVEDPISFSGWFLLGFDAFGLFVGMLV